MANRKMDLKERFKTDIVEYFYNEKLSMKEIQKQMEIAVTEMKGEIREDIEGMKKRME